MAHAEKFLVEKGYPQWTKVPFYELFLKFTWQIFIWQKIQRVVDGGEPTAFKQYFHIWRESEIVAPVYDKVYTLDRQNGNFLQYK